MRRFYGTADAAIPLARAEAARDGLGGPVTFIVVEGAAHASNVTHPDEVNQAILGFLSGLDGGLNGLRRTAGGPRAGHGPPRGWPA